MPGLNRTGPMGAGPMTGGGWGRCNPTAVEATPPVAFGSGRRRGFGGGFGRRKGRCRLWWPATALGADEQMEPAAEIEQLQAVADNLKKTLDRLNNRIEQLRRNKDDPPQGAGSQAREPDL